MGESHYACAFGLDCVFGSQSHNTGDAGPWENLSHDRLFSTHGAERRAYVNAARTTQPGTTDSCNAVGQLLARMMPSQWAGPHKVWTEADKQEGLPYA